MSMLDVITWDTITGFLNSNFTAALAGALAGALAAQRIGDRAKQRESLLQEIRSTNASLMVAFTICNAGLALKRQFTRDIHETYQAKKKEHDEFRRRLAAGQQLDQPFEFQADFRSLQMPLMPIDILRTQLYEKVSASGRPLALVGAIAGAIESLADVIKKRNDLIERFRTLPANERDRLLPALYFGVPFGPGHLSTEFPDTITALYNLTDDVIFFSELLCKDLMAHGNRVLDRYKKVAKLKEESVHSVDFSDARKQGLMPDAANYGDWLRGFPNAAQPALPADGPGPAGSGRR